MAERAPEPREMRAERAVQLVPAEIYNRFFEKALAENAGQQGELPLNTLQRGMADALYGRSNPGPGGFTSSYVDDVARYMERQQRRRAAEEIASNMPIRSATNTVQESLLNAPSSPELAPSAIADQLLRRRMGRPMT
jgi:hypothetical protein